MIPHALNMELSWLHQSKPWVLGLDFPQCRGKGEMAPGSGCLTELVLEAGDSSYLTHQEVCTISFESQMWRLPSHWCKWKGFNHIFQLTLRFAWWLWYRRSKTCRWEAHRVWWLGTEHPQAPAPGCACSTQLFWMLLWLSFSLHGKWIWFL